MSLCSPPHGNLLAGRTPPNPSHLPHPRHPLPHPGHHDLRRGQHVLHEVLLHVVHWRPDGGHWYRALQPPQESWTQGPALGGQFSSVGLTRLHHPHSLPLHVDQQHRQHRHDDPHPGGGLGGAGDGPQDDDDACHLLLSEHQWYGHSDRDSAQPDHVRVHQQVLGPPPHLRELDGGLPAPDVGEPAGLLGLAAAALPPPPLSPAQLGATASPAGEQQRGECEETPAEPLH